MSLPEKPQSNSLQLALGTGAFALCFAVFGSVSAMMPVLKKQFHLAPVQVSIAIAVPVLLGSLGRIPLGCSRIALAGAEFSPSPWRSLSLQLSSWAGWPRINKC